MPFLALLAYPRALLAGAAVVGLGILIWRLDASAYGRGVAACEATARAADIRRTDNANQADDLARRCAADPDCRMRRDPYRRD